ncbi:MarR family transcriptional regulator [Actinotalea sp. M2MS4P-6]|uniref:MarR family winged helix-turn-helix transcriptional regulator n=1 Tax=Actinotalea sp. M2MS4P-6 TaxID=2983762 RepID=UPI0021E46A54|nr:MarR family transcriptional regulator [Actinotalea sp. M2MS4P-6]MCV2394350.1 MarR family transcriptional regulator [Actinotalea sp. M2MS4P-6]
MGDTDPTLADQASEFAEVLGYLWQEATLATRSKGGLPVLPPSQALALRLVIATEGLTPTALAAEMRLSRPMVSEVLRKLEEQGLVERRRSRLDGRSVVLSATDRGHYVRESFRSGISAAMSEAFESLSARDIQRIMRSMPALDQLQKHLSGIADREEAAAAARGRGA